MDEVNGLTGQILISFGQRTSQYIRQRLSTNWACAQDVFLTVPEVPAIQFLCGASLTVASYSTCTDRASDARHPRCVYTGGIADLVGNSILQLSTVSDQQLRQRLRWRDTRPSLDRLNPTLSRISFPLWAVLWFARLDGS